MEEGVCPKCGSEKFAYGEGIENPNAGSGGHLVECSICGFKGIEWYVLCFDKYTDEDGLDIE